MSPAKPAATAAAKPSGCDQFQKWCRRSLLQEGQTDQIIQDLRPRQNALAVGTVRLHIAGAHAPLPEQCQSFRGFSFQGPAPLVTGAEQRLKLGADVSLGERPKFYPIPLTALSSPKGRRATQAESGPISWGLQRPASRPSVFAIQPSSPAPAAQVPSSKPSSAPDPVMSSPAHSSLGRPPPLEFKFLRITFSPAHPSSSTEARAALWFFWACLKRAARGIYNYVACHQGCFVGSCTNIEASSSKCPNRLRLTPTHSNSDPTSSYPAKWHKSMGHTLN